MIKKQPLSELLIWFRFFIFTLDIGILGLVDNNHFLANPLHFQNRIYE